MAGTVTYIAATDIATFTPTVSLAPSTTFTATITTGVADTYGNPLAANYMWTFTTSAACPLPPVSVWERPALSEFWPAPRLPMSLAPLPPSVGMSACGRESAVTGFGPPASITGTIDADDAVAQTAQGDLTTAYNNAAGAAGGAVLTADIGGRLFRQASIERRAPSPHWELLGTSPSMVRAIQMLPGPSRSYPR